MTLPDYTTPETLAKHLGWSERRVRDVARQFGTCRVLGNRMIFLAEDVKSLKNLVAKGAIKAGGPRTFIYFLRAGEFIKIGQSRRWKARLTQMQTGSPHTIIPLLVLIGEPKMESKLHSRFKADHFRGEWYHSGPAILAFIKENLSECVAKSEESDLRTIDPNSWDAAFL